MDMCTGPGGMITISIQPDLYPLQRVALNP